MFLFLPKKWISAISASCVRHILCFYQSHPSLILETIGPNVLKSHCSFILIQLKKPSQDWTLRGQDTWTAAANCRQVKNHAGHLWNAPLANLTCAYRKPHLAAKVGADLPAEGSRTTSGTSWCKLISSGFSYLKSAPEPNSGSNCWAAATSCSRNPGDKGLPEPELKRRGASWGSVSSWRRIIDSVIKGTGGYNSGGGGGGEVVLLHLCHGAP